MTMMLLHGAPAADSRSYRAPLPLRRAFRCTGWCGALVPLAAAHRDIADVVSRDAEPARAQGCPAPRVVGRNLALGAPVGRSFALGAPVWGRGGSGRCGLESRAG